MSEKKDSRTICFGGQRAIKLPTIVSYEWCNQSYSSIEEVWEAKEKSTLVEIVGELSGPITRRWSDGETDTTKNPRILRLRQGETA